MVPSAVQKELSGLTEVEDCFFRSVSHRYYGSPDFHIEIRQAGVKYLQEHPELFVESVSEHS